MARRMLVLPGMKTSWSLTPFALSWALLACGGAARRPEPQAAEAEDAESRAAREQREELERSRPASPLETQRRTGYRSRERCGQGPYRMEVPALAARYSEQLVVYACGRREVSGALRLTVIDRDGRQRTDERAYGWSRDNKACVAAPEERAQLAPATQAPKADPPAGRGRRRGSPTSAAEAPAAPALEVVHEIPPDCPSRSFVLDQRWTMEDGIPLDRSRFTLELWSEEPNDLEGLVFVVEQRAPSASMTREQWAAYRAAEALWYERYKAASDEDLRSGRTVRLDDKVRAPTPPAPRRETPPLRPSKNAVWIPGYWHHEAGEFHWLVGFWRVPPSDVAQQLTARAPRPPPPPRAEPAVRKVEAPSQRAVWTPGYWQWDGQAFLWVKGAWRLPPSEHHTWVPTRWEVSAAGVTLSPGGWSIRLGR